MKIRFWDRVILLFGAMVTCLVGTGVFVVGLQIHGTFGENMPLLLRVSCLVFGPLCAAFGAYLLMFPRRYAIQRRDYVVQRTDSGELRISVKAIENLVKTCIRLHEEIQLISMCILNAREGVVVELNVSLANNISIPLAVASLQKQIKQYLVASSGIEVKEVRVTVENTQDNPAVVAEAEEEEENEPEKAPLHQRLFCQAEQPAIVPEPPKPEETQEDSGLVYEGADAPAPQPEEKQHE